MTDQRATATKQPFFTLPACLVVASLICAITTEELLGNQTLSLGGTTVSSYVVLCAVQTVAAAGLLIFGPRLDAIIDRPLALVGIVVGALIGSMLMTIVSDGSLVALAFLGFVLLSLVSLALKITNLEMFADAPPWKLAILIFIAVLLQSAVAPIFTLPSTAIWVLAGLIATLSIALIAAARRALERSRPAFDAPRGFRRPFSPSAPILVGVAIICAGISFLNPLGFYDSITPSDFLSFTFLAHFVAAALFGVIAFVSRDSSHAIAFKSVNSIILIGFFLMALLGAASFVPRAVCTTSFSLFEFITFLAIADLASYSRTNRLRLFGGYYLLLRASSLAGIALNAGDVAFAPLGIEASLFGSLLAAACIIAALWLLTEPHLNRFFWGDTATVIGREIDRAQGRDTAEASGAKGASKPGDGEEGRDTRTTSAAAACAADLTSLIDRSVSRLAEEHGLTPREQEVFALMAQGRSATFIGEELFVSTNTVRKHIAHVYEKLGIHSKQELLTLVQQESAEMSAR